MEPMKSFESGWALTNSILSAPAFDLAADLVEELESFIALVDQEKELHGMVAGAADKQAVKKSFQREADFEGIEEFQFSVRGGWVAQGLSYLLEINGPKGFKSSIEIAPLDQNRLQIRGVREAAGEIDRPREVLFDFSDKSVSGCDVYQSFREKLLWAVPSFEREKVWQQFSGASKYDLKNEVVMAKYAVFGDDGKIDIGETFRAYSDTLNGTRDKSELLPKGVNSAQTHDSDVQNWKNHTRLRRLRELTV